MFKFALVCCLVGVAWSAKDHVDNISKQFSAAFSKFHGEEALQELLKRGDNTEIKERVENFRVAVQTIEDVNDNKNTKFSAAVNHITVMTDAEKKAMLNLNPMNATEGAMTKRANDSWDWTRRSITRTKRQIPKSVDWIARGAQNAVKNQGGCGSCWAFAAVSSLEGNYFIKTGELVAFSEQEYLDCTMENYYAIHKSSWSKDHSGCNGGMMTWAYEYTSTVNRMASMADFPYKAEDRACDMSGVPDSLEKVKVTGTEFVSGSDARLAEAVAESLVTVAILVVSDFSYYRSGIFSCLPGVGSGHCDCSVSLNHAVTVVGYAAGYWNVRNSWGPNWGDGGYIKMSRAQDNICNINMVAQRPTLECKEGMTCDGWTDNGDEEDEEEEEIEFEMGDDINCGDIVHFGERCVDMDDTSNMYAVLSSMCNRDICYTSLGYLRDQATGMCITADSSANNAAVRFGKCSTAKQWEETGNGFKLKGTGSCWHPNGGSPNPYEDTRVVVWGGSCSAYRVSFEFEDDICWEEVANSKLGTFIKSADGQTIKSKELNEAKDACVDHQDCNSLYYSNNEYFLSGEKKAKTSEKSGDKAFIQVACEESCDAGTMLCDDGECKETCSDDDEGCPAGTAMCSDGVCRHEHMC